MQQQKFGWRFIRVSELLLLHHEFLHDSCHKKLFVKRKIQVIMKQKNFLFAGLCALSLITWEVQAVSILPKKLFKKLFKNESKSILCGSKKIHK